MRLGCHYFSLYVLYIMELMQNAAFRLRQHGTFLVLPVVFSPGRAKKQPTEDMKHVACVSVYYIPSHGITAKIRVFSACSSSGHSSSSPPAGNGCGGSAPRPSRASR